MSQVRKGRLDPIELLREYIIQKKQIRLRKDKKGVWQLQFDGIELKCQMETAWKSVKTQREYCLGSLWWFLESKQKKLDSKEYRSKTMELNIDAVMMVDQQEIEEYFSGKIDYTECINAEKKSQLYKGKFDPLEPNLTKKIRRQNDEEGEFPGIDLNIRVIEEILRFEKPITTKNRQFRCVDKTFENVLQVSKKVLYGQSSKNEDDMNGENTMAFNGSLLQEILITKQRPIIIVPQIFELGNVCLKNIQKLLQDGEYVDPTSQKFTLETRSVDVTHQLKYLKQDINFEVRDTPNSSDPKSWKKVVAIFVRGSNYELKSFPGGRDINYFFKRYRGYHMKFEDDQPKETIKQWNVKLLELHRNKRHYDKSVVNSFWDDLEAFILKPAFKEKQ